MTAQKENGYTRIPNILLEKLGFYRLSGEERQILDAVMRKTFGYNKEADVITLSQFCIATQMTKAAVCRAIRKLRLKKIIETKKVNMYTSYLINTNYDEWTNESLKYDREAIFMKDKYVCYHCEKKFDVNELEVDHLIPLVENGSNKPENLVTSCRTCNRKRGVAVLTQWQNRHSVKNVNKGVAKKIISPVAKQTHTKENITKDNVTKEISITNVIEGKEINVLISSFQKINPSYKTLYPNKGQRQALERLLNEHGREKVELFIQGAIYAFGKPFSPTITTPFELERKLGALTAFLQREKWQVNKFAVTKV